MQPNIQSPYIPLVQWNQHYTWPTVRQLREFVFFAEQNGFRKCFLRCGGRILIVPEALWAWAKEIDAKGGKH